jgi:hypothetical protein
MGRYYVAVRLGESNGTPDEENCGERASGDSHAPRHDDTDGDGHHDAGNPQRGWERVGQDRKRYHNPEDAHDGQCNADGNRQDTQDQHQCAPMFSEIPIDGVRRTFVTHVMDRNHFSDSPPVFCSGDTVRIRAMGGGVAR